MRILCLTTFLDGRQRYEKGDVVTVDDDRGAHFVQHAWAQEVGADFVAPVAPEEVTLDIQDAGQTQEVPRHG